MKKNLFKRAMAMGLSVLMVSGLSGCNGSEGKDFTLEGGDPNDLPQQISMMADTVVLPENGLSNFCDEFKKQTGIGLSVEKPDHAKYYEKVTLAFASEEPADLIEMGSTYYPELANSGALWDMTDAWNNSTSNCKKIIDEQYVDALKINGQLYGFPMSAGNGTVTYVREDWLKEAGLDAPYEDLSDIDNLSDEEQSAMITEHKKRISNVYNKIQKEREAFMKTVG